MTNGLDFLLVIPAFCEQDRLPAFLQELIRMLSDAAFTTTILIVDDGSPNEQRLQLGQRISTGTFGTCVVLNPLFLEQNVGKGHAILTGWASDSSPKWMAFVDADGAIPAYEVFRLFCECHRSKDEACRFATRIRMLGRKINRRPVRHLCGRLFATVVAGLTNTGVYDTQCGFKIVTGSMFAAIQPRLKESGFCFDIELLLALRSAGATIFEVPIDWDDKPGGHVNLIKHGPQMLIALLLMLRRKKQWPEADAIGSVVVKANCRL